MFSFKPGDVDSSSCNPVRRFLVLADNLKLPPSLFHKGCRNSPNGACSHHHYTGLFVPHDFFPDGPVLAWLDALKTLTDLAKNGLELLHFFHLPKLTIDIGKPDLYNARRGYE